MADINVTPMVDVMLVLLVVFMVTAPLLTVGVPVDLPQTQAPAINEPKEPTVITVNKEGEIFIQDTSRRRWISWCAKLQAITNSNPDARASMCAATRTSITAGARGDEPDQQCRVPQGLAGRRGSQGRRRRQAGPAPAASAERRPASGSTAMSVMVLERGVPVDSEIAT